MSVRARHTVFLFVGVCGLTIRTERNSMAIEKAIEAMQAAAAGAGSAGAEEPEKDPRDVVRYSDNDVDRIVKKKLDRQRKQLMEEQAAGEQVSELDQREQAIAIRERKADAREALAEAGIPKEFAELMRFGSEEEYNASLDAVKGIMDKVREQIARERATGRTPKATHSSPPDNTREAFGLT